MRELLLGHPCDYAALHNGVVWIVIYVICFEAFFRGRHRQNLVQPKELPVCALSGLARSFNLECPKQFVAFGTDAQHVWLNFSSPRWVIQLDYSLQFNRVLDLYIYSHSFVFLFEESWPSKEG